MKTRCVLFVSRENKRFISPVINGDKAERGKEECDIRWTDAMRLFQSAGTYPDFIKASVFVQSHYKERYEGTPYLVAKPCHILRGKELLPEVDQFYVVRARQFDSGRKADLRRLSDLMDINCERNAIIEELEAQREAGLLPADNAPKTKVQRRFEDINLVFDAICSELKETDDVRFDPESVDFSSIRIVEGYVDKDANLHGPSGNLLARSSNGKPDLVYEGFPCFVNQRCGPCGDDYSGTMYFPRTKAMKSFFAIPFEMF